MALMDESQRGDQAAAVLNNPVYQEAYAKVETAIFNMWGTAASAAEAEHLRQMGQLLRKLRAVLEGVMATGRIADKAMQAERTRMERLKDALRTVA